jgi:hypothetical protein
MPNFVKILSVEAQLFHADRRMDAHTDMPKLIIAFRKFAKAPKKSKEAKVIGVEV